MQEEKTPILLITSSAGGGHTTAADAIQDALQVDASEIPRIDLIIDFGPFYGRMLSNLWNKAQKQGSLTALNWMGKQKRLIDALLYWSVFRKCLRYLFRYKPARVIDTQPLGTKPLLRAIRVYNAKYNTKVRLEKYITDVPTKGAVHFFSRMQRLSDRERKDLDVMAIAPFLEKGQTEKEFWYKHTKLPAKQIHILQNPFLRKEFFPYIGKNREETAEKNGAFSIPMTPFSSAKKQTLSLKKNAFLITFILGANPPKKALYSYIEKLQKMSFTIPCFAVFCGCTEDIHQLCNPFSTSQKGSICTHILPLQTASTIAPLIHRSDLLIMKSGGQTVMEALGVATGDMYIHSEHTEGIQGIACWEKNNAEYLMQKRGAKIVSTKSFSSLLQESIEKHLA